MKEGVKMRWSSNSFAIFYFHYILSWTKRLIKILHQSFLISYVHFRRIRLFVFVPPLSHAMERNALWRRTPRSVLPRFSIFYGGTPVCRERGLINIANQPECRPWHVEKCRSTCLVRSLKSPDSSVVTKQFKVSSIPIKPSRKTVADSAQTSFYPYSQLCFQPLKIMTIKKCIHKDVNRVINS